MKDLAVLVVFAVICFVAGYSLEPSMRGWLVAPTRAAQPVPASAPAPTPEPTPAPTPVPEPEP